MEKIRVLLAEDDALVATVIERELEKTSAVVIGKANDGRQAVEFTKILRPDIVLMDIEMPEMNGLEAAREIQRICPTPVIVLTVYAGQKLFHQAAVAGVCAYLLKPPRAQELERTMIIAQARFADLLELARLNTELADAITRVKTLSGLLPICANCKRIRDEAGHWQPLEYYIQAHSEANFSHGICPECRLKHYPELH